jgi:hypothetical protein
MTTAPGGAGLKVVSPLEPQRSELEHDVRAAVERNNGFSQ